MEIFSKLPIAGRLVFTVSDKIATTDAPWARLKLVAPTHHSSKVVAQFETSLATPQEVLKNKKASLLMSEANNRLELVDTLETILGFLAWQGATMKLCCNTLLICELESRASI